MMEKTAKVPLIKARRTGILVKEGEEGDFIQLKEQENQEGEEESKNSEAAETVRLRKSVDNQIKIVTGATLGDNLER